MSWTVFLKLLLICSDVKLLYFIRSRMSICIISLVISCHLQNHPCIYLENGMVSIAFLTVFERTKGSSVRHKGKGLRDFVASIFNMTSTPV